MKKKLLGSTLAAAIALTSFTVTPAHAENDNFWGKVIFGAVALAILNEQLERKRDASRAQPTKPSKPKVEIVHNRKVLPSECLRKHRTDHGRVKLVGHRCLKNNYKYTAFLPDRCFSRITNLNNKKRKGFRPRCLKKHGYKFG